MDDEEVGDWGGGLVFGLELVDSFGLGFAGEEEMVFWELRRDLVMKVELILKHDLIFKE